MERITSRVHQDLLEKERSRLAVRLELVPTTACDVERMDIVLLNVLSTALPAPSSASVESVAYDPMETGLVIFQDASGHERPDSAMLDPGASAYLSGYGPFKRYVEHLLAAILGSTLEVMLLHGVGGCARFPHSWTVAMAPFNAT